MIINPTKEPILHIPFNVNMRGFKRIQLINKFSGKVRWDSGFFPNKILTSGRNIMSTTALWMTHCHLGTDSTPPSSTDTSLLGLVATTSTIQSTTSGSRASAPYYGWKRRTFRFSPTAGQAGQNLSEAGIGWGVAPSNLVSRALIIDPISQLPTTVTPLVDELVDVTYELRYYPPLSDVLQTVTLDGLVYDTVTRAALVNDGVAWAYGIGEEIRKDCAFVTDWRAYDGAIGSLLTLPSGLTANLASVTEVFDKAYSNNSYTQGMQANLSINSWNLAAGIRCINIKTTAGAYQTSFTRQGGGGERIPKSISYTMTLVWNVSWTEGTI